MAFRSAAGTGIDTDHTTGFTLDIPADVEVDDILVLVLPNKGADADATVTDDDTGGNTWTKKGHVTNLGRHQVWWKRATSGTASKTITVADCTESTCGVIAAYSGRLATGDPFNAFLSEANAPGDETMAEITPSVDGCDILLGVSLPDNVTTSAQACTNPGVLTERAEATSAGGFDSGVSLADAPQTTAAATGAFTWSQVNRNGGSFAMALAPAGGAVVAPAAGGLTVAGLAPTILTPRTVAPAAGALTLSGQAPTVLMPRTVTPAAGAATLTGFAPTITVSAGTVVQPGLGALTATGLAPTILTPRVLTPAAGTLTLAGLAATIVTPRVVLPGLGALTTTGFAPTIRAGVGAIPGLGTITLTGFVPTIIAPVSALPGVGTLTLTGYAPTVTVGITQIAVVVVRSLAPRYAVTRTLAPRYDVET